MNKSTRWVAIAFPDPLGGVTHSPVDYVMQAPVLSALTAFNLIFQNSLIFPHFSIYYALSS